VIIAGSAGTIAVEQQADTDVVDEHIYREVSRVKIMVYSSMNVAKPLKPVM